MAVRDMAEVVAMALDRMYHDQYDRSLVDRLLLGYLIEYKTVQ